MFRKIGSRLSGSRQVGKGSELAREIIALTAEVTDQARTNLATVFDPSSKEFWPSEFRADDYSGRDDDEPSIENLPLAEGLFRQERDVVEIRGRRISPSELSILCGPKRIDSAEQILQTAMLLARAGVSFFRADVRTGSKFRKGGVNLPRARMAANAAARFGLRTVFPVQTAQEFSALEHFADLLELSPELSWNKRFLDEVSFRPVTVLLSKRPFLQLEQWLEMADLVTRRGEAQVLLLESGITTSRGLAVDLQTIIDAQRYSTHPIIVNCYSTAKDWSYVEQLAAAVLSAGADGILLQVEGNVLQSAPGVERTVFGESFVPMTKRLAALRATLNATELMKRQGSSER